MIHHRIPDDNMYLKRYTTYMEKLSYKIRKIKKCICHVLPLCPNRMTILYTTVVLLATCYLYFLLLWPLSPVQLPFLITTCFFFHSCSALDSACCFFLHSRYFSQLEWQLSCLSVQPLQGNVTIVIFPLSVCSCRQLYKTWLCLHYLLHHHYIDISDHCEQTCLLFF